MNLRIVRSSVPRQHVILRFAQAKRLLGWSPKHTITDDLAEYFEGYQAAGKVEAEPDFNKVRVGYAQHLCRKDCFLRHRADALARRVYLLLYIECLIGRSPPLS